MYYWAALIFVSWRHSSSTLYWSIFYCSQRTYQNHSGQNHVALAVLYSCQQTYSRCHLHSPMKVGLAQQTCQHLHPLSFGRMGWSWSWRKMGCRRRRRRPISWALPLAPERLSLDQRRDRRMPMASARMMKHSYQKTCQTDHQTAVHYLPSQVACFEPLALVVASICDDVVGVHFLPSSLGEAPGKVAGSFDWLTLQSEPVHLDQPPASSAVASQRAGAASQLGEEV